MKLAFFSDVHANLPALRAALSAIEEQGAEVLVFAGDAVGTGPFPNETVRLLAELDGLRAIQGNVDRRVLKQARKKTKKLRRKLEEGTRKRRNRAWTALVLEADAYEWLNSLPSELSFEVEGRRVLVVHGSPLGDSDYIYPSLTEEALERKLAPVEGRRPDLLVMGHSHVPFAREIAGTMVVNCGSVGKPADGDPRGSFAIVEIRGENPIRAEIVRFAYPFDELEQAIAEREVPDTDINDYREGLRG